MSKREELRKRRQAEARRKQLYVVGAVALVAVLVAAWLIWPTLQPVGEITAIETQEYPLADGSALGPADAPVLIQVFSDFQCPFCQQFALGPEQQIIEAYGDSGQVRLDYLHYLVVDRNVGSRESQQAAEAAECAGQQGEFWNYHDIVFTNQRGEGQGAYADKRLVAMAESIGLDMGAFNGCFNTSATANLINADEALATSMGVTGTPSVFFNGVRVPDANVMDFNYYQQRIEAEISATQ
jgi:protein-disulfide isomerase